MEVKGRVAKWGACVTLHVQVELPDPAAVTSHCTTSGRHRRYPDSDRHDRATMHKPRTVGSAVDETPNAMIMGTGLAVWVSALFDVAGGGS